METIRGARRVALFTALYAGGLSGTLSLLALFLIGFDLIALASGLGGPVTLAAVPLLPAFRIFNVVALLGGLAGSLLAARHDFSGGALGVYKSILAAVNLLVLPLVLVLQAGAGGAAPWVAFLAGGVMSSANLLALLYCQYRMSEPTYRLALRYTGTFAAAGVLGGILERFAFAAPSNLLLHFAAHGLLLVAAAAAAFYALVAAREVWEPLQKESAVAEPA